MINKNLHDFVGAVSANRQIRYGDVRRLQRDILPSGIVSRDEAEILVALNAQLDRANRAWAQWLVVAVTEFVANQDEGGHSIEQAAGEWLGRLGAPSSTRFGRGIAHKLRRALGPRHDTRSSDAEITEAKTTSRCERARPRQVPAPKAKKRSPRRSKARCAATPKARRRPVTHGAVTCGDAGFGWSLPGYLPAMRQCHLMNFPSARVGLVLAPCR